MKAKFLLAGIIVLFALFSGTALAEQAATPGAVYTMTNAPEGNQVVAFDRNAGGILTDFYTVSTGGLGSGGDLDPLGSQGSLVMTPDQRWLLAVNAGSNDISVFEVEHGGLALSATTGTGGSFPVSVTVHHDLVYVLNAGTSPNINGFTLSPDGELTPLPGSTRTLDSGAFAQVGFDPQGRWLVITDKENHEIVVFSVDRDGLPAMSPMVSASSGLVPFGIIFDQQGHLLVSEAGSGAASSYEILESGALEVISGTVANGQMASCWIAGNQRYAFTANTASDNLSSYEVMAGSGDLTLLQMIAGTGNLPLDMDTSRDGRFLYVLNAGDGTIGMFRINAGGSLTDLGTASAGMLAIFAQGLAAR